MSEPEAPVGWPGTAPPVRPTPAPAAADPPASAPASAAPPASAPPSAAPPAAAPAPPPAGPPVAPRPGVGSTAVAPPARGLTVGPAPTRRPGRRARLTVRRIDPWSVLKFSFVYSLAGLVVLLVAVVALYGIVDAMGVIDSIRSFLNDVSQPKNGEGVASWLSFGRVLTVAIVVGVINVILFTAFATLTAFIYNVCTDLVGGVEVTLAERP